MYHQIRAEVGNWYRSKDGALFEVTDLDDDLQVVQLQHFEGDVETLNYLDWEDRSPSEAPSPEEWTGPYINERLDLNTEDALADYSSPTANRIKNF